MDCFQIGHIECVVLHLAHFELVIMSGSLACLCVDRIVRTSQVGDDAKVWNDVGDDVGVLRGKQRHGCSCPFTYREMVLTMVVLTVVIQ